MPGDWTTSREPAKRASRDSPAGVELGEFEGGIESVRQFTIGTDEQDRTAGAFGLGEQQFDEDVAAIGVQRRGRRAGSSDLRPAPWPPAARSPHVPDYRHAACAPARTGNPAARWPPGPATAAG